MPKCKISSQDCTALHDLIQRKIYILRGKKVMLDRDLAELYGAPTKALNQAVQRNLERFPENFMFRLNKDETQNWRSQFVTSNLVGFKMGVRRAPYAFTEQGVAIISGILKSKIAIRVNIQIMRTFIRLRQMITANELIRQRLDTLEKATDKHDHQIQMIFETIRELLEKPTAEPEKEIGFHTQIRKD